MEAAAMQILHGAIALVNAAANGGQGPGGINANFRVQAPPQLERDPAPPGGYPQHRKDEDYPGESVWEHELWPESRIPTTSTIMKTKAKETFLLTPHDMCDLWYYRYQPVGQAHPAMKYFKKDCERRAWEIYGGPTGLAAARRAKAARARGPRMPAAAAPHPAPLAPPQAVPIARRGGRGREGRLPAGQALRGGAPPLVTQIRRPHIPPRVNTAMQPVSNPPRTASSTTQSSQMTRPMASQPVPEIPAGGPSTPRRNPQTAGHRSPARTSSSLLEALDSISLDTPAPLARLPPSSVQRSPGKRKRAGTRGDSNEVVGITDDDKERKGHVYLISKNGVVESPKKRRKAAVGSVRVKNDPQEVIEISD